MATVADTNPSPPFLKESSLAMDAAAEDESASATARLVASGAVLKAADSAVGRTHRRLVRMGRCSPSK